MEDETSKALFSAKKLPIIITRPCNQPCRQTLLVLTIGFLIFKLGLLMFLKMTSKSSHFTIQRAKRATLILQLIWILTTKSYLFIPILTEIFCSFGFCNWFSNPSGNGDSNPSGNGDSMSPLWWGSLWLFLPIWWLVMHETICRECIRHRSFFHSISPKNSQSLTTTWKIRLFVFFRHKINLTTNRQKRKMEREDRWWTWKLSKEGHLPSYLLSVIRLHMHKRSSTYS